MSIYPAAPSSYAILSNSRFTNRIYYNNSKCIKFCVDLQEQLAVSGERLMFIQVAKLQLHAKVNRHNFKFSSKTLTVADVTLELERVSVFYVIVCLAILLMDHIPQHVIYVT
ncbi:hypothetical protein CEXT_232631 [Caerostris extrusa]|uniref:Uncharacterized protein n=1 Tax=Caerostris extrusa TaxID=172846 RepID=A0AAV4TD74_CAEEX|nr:hypothetical protein CEXT_232631 [Caerostris extrusa]